MAVYEPSKKHHFLKGWGNLCPRGITAQDAQNLLNEAHRFDNVAHPDRYYIVSNGFLFEAQPTDRERDVWHGYPVLGAENADVINAMLAQGLLDRRTARRLRRQREKPGSRGGR